jgi:hypothetical protein
MLLLFVRGKNNAKSKITNWLLSSLHQYRNNNDYMKRGNRGLPLYQDLSLFITNTTSSHSCSSIQAVDSSINVLTHIVGALQKNLSLWREMDDEPILYILVQAPLYLRQYIPELCVRSTGLLACACLPKMLHDVLTVHPYFLTGVVFLIFLLVDGSAT